MAGTSLSVTSPPSNGLLSPTEDEARTLLPFAQGTALALGP